MASNLPINFAIPGESAIASYNWTDVADGTGVITFYASAKRDSSGYDYVLGTDESERTSLEYTQASSSSSSSAEKIIDLDFDLTAFNSPRIIRGTAKFTIPFNHKSTVGTKTSYGYVIGVLKKYYNSVETIIGTATSISHTSTSSTYSTPVIAEMSASLTKTHFEKGSILRLTLEGWGIGETGVTGSTVVIPYVPRDYNITISGTLTFDPENNPNTQTSQVKVIVPFDIDL